MTLETLSHASTEVQGEMTWESDSITGQQLRHFFSGSGKAEEEIVRSVMDALRAGNRVFFQEYGVGINIGANHILGQFLRSERVALRNMRATVVGPDADLDALLVRGPSVAIQMIRAESTEGYAAWPPAKDTTSVAVFDPAREEFPSSYLQKIIRDAADEVFFDGMDSVFANQLKIFVEQHGGIAVRAIEDLVKSTDTNIEIVGEMLRVIGSIENPATHGARLTVLLAGLASPDPRVRDSASLGIAALDDASVVDEVIAAVHREHIPELRDDLQLVVDQLNSTEWQIS